MGGFTYQMARRTLSRWPLSLAIPVYEYTHGPLAHPPVARYSRACPPRVRVLAARPVWPPPAPASDAAASGAKPAEATRPSSQASAAFCGFPRSLGQPTCKHRRHVASRVVARVILRGMVCLGFVRCIVVYVCYIEYGC